MRTDFSYLHGCRWHTIVLSYSRIFSRVKIFLEFPHSSSEDIFVDLISELKHAAHLFACDHAHAWFLFSWKPTYLRYPWKFASRENFPLLWYVWQQNRPVYLLLFALCWFFCCFIIVTRSGKTSHLVTIFKSEILLLIFARNGDHMSRLDFPSWRYKQKCLTFLHELFLRKTHFYN